MSNKRTFHEVLDAVEHLPIEQQSHMVDVVQRRLAEHRRRQVVAEVQEARAEFAAGNAKASTPDDLLKEITS
jgi:hypothetical protein